MSETPSKAVLRLQSSIKQLQILKGSATVGELAQSFALDIETHELALAEITSLRAQLDEARRLGGKHIIDASRQLNEKDDEIKSAVDEARRKAIEQCAAIAKTYGGDCDLMISEFRALLSESKT